MDFVICAAADCGGKKVNLCFKLNNMDVLALTLYELYSRMSFAFSNYLASAQRCPFVSFQIHYALVFNDVFCRWDRVEHISQVLAVPNGQLYLVQDHVLEVPGALGPAENAAPYLTNYASPLARFHVATVPNTCATSQARAPEPTQTSQQRSIRFSVPGVDMRTVEKPLPVSTPPATTTSPSFIPAAEPYDGDVSAISSIAHPFMNGGGILKPQPPAVHTRNCASQTPTLQSPPREDLPSLSPKSLATSASPLRMQRDHLDAGGVASPSPRKVPYMPYSTTVVGHAPSQGAADTSLGYYARQAAERPRAADRGRPQGNVSITKLSYAEKYARYHRPRTPSPGTATADGLVSSHSTRVAPPSISRDYSQSSSYSPRGATSTTRHAGGGGDSILRVERHKMEEQSNMSLDQLRSALRNE